MSNRHIGTQIPKRKTRKMRVGANHGLSRLRNMVERCFDKLKNTRRVVTRSDRTAESDLDVIDIASIRLWVRHLST